MTNFDILMWICETIGHYILYFNKTMQHDFKLDEKEI